NDGRFDSYHAFALDVGPGPSDNYDGAILEYSTNNGQSWIDAFNLIEAGQSYNGTIQSCCDNPLAGRFGFVRTSFGYTGTRLNLATLAGQSVKFRFRVGSDDVINGLGWLVDNIALYKCTALFTDDPLAVPGIVIKRIHV